MLFPRFTLFASIAALTLAVLSSPAHSDDTSPKPRIVATVNGHELTETDFWKRCETLVGGGNDTAVGFVALQEWIKETLAEDDAKSRNILPTAKDVERRAFAVRKQFEFRGQSFDEWLESHGRTPESLREDLRQQLIVENLLTEGVKLPEGKVEVYYSTHKGELGLGDQIRVSRITVDQKDAAHDVEEALKKRSFEDVAKEFSKDQFKKFGGKVPDPIDAVLKANSALEPAIMEKVLKLEPGKWVGPIKIEDYWVFAKLEAKIPPRAPDIGDVQDLILANLKVQAAGEERLKAARDRMNKLQREARIEIFRPEYRSILKSFKETE